MRAQLFTTLQAADLQFPPQALPLHCEVAAVWSGEVFAYTLFKSTAAHDVLPEPYTE